MSPRKTENRQKESEHDARINARISRFGAAVQVPRQARRVHAVGSIQTRWGREGASACTNQAPAQEQALRLLARFTTFGWASIDNDTRMLFATVYDGAWDQYIDDFVASPEMNATIRSAVGEFGGLPGHAEPRGKGVLSQVSGPGGLLLDRSALTQPSTDSRGESVCSQASSRCWTPLADPFFHLGSGRFPCSLSSGKPVERQIASLLYHH